MAAEAQPAKRARVDTLRLVVTFYGPKVDVNESVNHMVVHLFDLPLKGYASRVAHLAFVASDLSVETSEEGVAEYEEADDAKPVDVGSENRDAERDARDSARLRAALRKWWKAEKMEGNGPIDNMGKATAEALDGDTFTPVMDRGTSDLLNGLDYSFCGQHSGPTLPVFARVAESGGFSG